MTVVTGSRLGVYEVTAQLGVGGMGEVYRARDTRLKRDVALKILPESFAADPERLARFQREAELLASLNHPHIAAIYGIEESNGIQALVMELVEGETLADRIARGPLPLDEALHIARQIAEALEAAHEQGIVHRDLKPANIKITTTDDVKVLDFGLAKLGGPASPSRTRDVTASPTITSPAMMTGVGVLLGTAAYMAPEQAKGRPADKRSDIWAFGCVVYEMLTGNRAFGGEDVTETLAAILMREPDWNALPRTTPPTIRTLLKACLEKNPRDRFGDIAAPLFLMSDRASFVSAPTPSGSVEVRHSPLSRGMVALALGALFGGAIVGSVWFAIRPSEPRVSRLTLTWDESALTINGGANNVAITPDGSRIVYVGNNGRELYVRRLDALEAVSIFKGEPRGPFVSPDGQWVGFLDGLTVLKRVAITGGPAITVATVDGTTRGATWPSANTIVFATAAANTGLQQVSIEGGPVTVLTRPDRGRGDADHLWPELLPGGRAVLFTIVPISGGIDTAQVAVLDLNTGTQKIVVRGGSDAHYVSSGHLVYAAARTLRAVPFDPVRLETNGIAVPVVPDVLVTTPPAVGGVDAAVASDGTLAYIRGTDPSRVARRTLSWIDRQGREAAMDAPPRLYGHPHISPDGERVALWATDEDSDIWLWDIRRSTLSRLTFTPAVDNFPVWTADGQRLIFASERDGTRNLFSVTANGTAAVERLTRSPNFQVSNDVTPDGRQAIFTETSTGTSDDIMQVELNGNHEVMPLVRTQFMERNGTVSPDGRWLAYEANDSGRFEIHVRPYPEVNSGHWQVSSGGGTQPRWSHNGQELFYASTGALMRVGVEHGPSWAPTTPMVILRGAYVPTDVSAIGVNTYDVAPDGQRFLVFKTSTDAKAAPPPQIVVVQHFDQELKRLVTTK